MGELFGVVEAGGTKMVCAVGTGPDDLRDEVRFPTAGPPATLARVVDYFGSWQKDHEETISAIGYGTFGPCDPNPDSPGYGRIASTPKPGWSGFDVIGELAKHLEIPIGFDTDVNAAALGEHRWGAGRGLRNMVYLTIGTGIGGGVIVNGELLHGSLHPEVGHMRVPHDQSVDHYEGYCPFHGDCLEGLASGPAIGGRWHLPARILPHDHPGWALEAHYLALACQNLICTLSPERIVLGGGVMAQWHLYDAIRSEVAHLLGGYIQDPRITTGIEGYIVPPTLGNQSGIAGCIALARAALAREERS